MTRVIYHNWPCTVKPTCGIVSSDWMGSYGPSEAVRSCLEATARVSRPVAEGAGPEGRPESADNLSLGARPERAAVVERRGAGSRPERGPEHLQHRFCGG